MNTNTQKSSIARAIGAAILLAVPIGALASDEGSDIIVQPTFAMDQWQEETTHDLNRALSKGGVRFRGEPNSAIVQITFSLGEDGKADDVRLYNDDGNWFAKRIALRAVKRLDNLDEVPVDNPQDVQFLANIIFANDERTQERLSRRLAESEAERMATAGKARTYLALSN